MARWAAETGQASHGELWQKLDVVAELIPFGEVERFGGRARGGSVAAGENRRPPARPTAFQVAERSLFGVADAAFEVALLPEEIMANHVVDVRHRFRRLRYDEFRARHPDRAPQEPPPWAWRFRSNSYFLDRSDATPKVRRLYRGQVAEVPTDADGLRAGAVLAMEYLERSVGAEGRFAYSYSPGLNRVDTSYNMVRHAGTIYAMLEFLTYEAAAGRPDAGLLAAADRATDYLIDQVRPCPRLRPERSDGEVPDHRRRHGLCMVEADESKLGGHGLAVLALLQHPDVEDRPDRLEVAMGLGERILSMLQPNGQFDPHKVRWSDGTHIPFESEYYPGEAIYALARLFRVTGEQRWLEGARRASDYRVRVRYAEDGEFTDDTIPHDHWLAYGLRELAELDPKPWDQPYLRRLGRLIAGAQHGDDVDPPDWAGGFYEPPRSAPTATRAEALGSILTVLGGPDATTADEWNVLSHALCRALAFQLRSQYTPARAFYTQEPQRALGGIAGSLTDDEIRIDFPQHTSSSLVAAAGLMEKGWLSCAEQQPVVH